MFTHDRNFERIKVSFDCGGMLDLAFQTPCSSILCCILRKKTLPARPRNIEMGGH